MPELRAVLRTPLLLGAVSTHRRPSRTHRPHGEHLSHLTLERVQKIEGMALMDDGNVYVCNDNDGVDDNSGETQLLNVGGIL